MSEMPRIGPVACCVMIVTDLNAATQAYCNSLHQTLTQTIKLDAATAEALDYPSLAGATTAVLANNVGRQWLLMIECSDATPREPLSTHGWLAQEVLVEDVDALAASLEGSAFTMLRPPANLDVSEGIRACQVRGPAGEILYLTQVKAQQPPFELPMAEAFVDHLFIPVLSTPDRDATLKDYETLAGNTGVRFDTRITVVNQALGLPLEQRHPIASLQLADRSLIEIDYIEQAVPAPADICAGTAAIVFHAAGDAPTDAQLPVAGPFAGTALRAFRGTAGERSTLLYSI